jgi:hypothetical protein
MITYNPVTCSQDSSLQAFFAQFELTISPLDFLLFRGNTSSSNFDRVLRHNSADHAETNQNAFDSGTYGSIVFSAGTTLLMPNANIKREILRPVEPQQFSIADFKPFIADAFDKLINDPRYTTTLSANGAEVGSVSISEFTVLMWVRALSPISSTDGTWINVSSFIESIQLTNGNEGAAFTLIMQPVTCQPSGLNGWEFKSNLTDSGNDVLVSGSLFRAGNKFRNDFFFHTCVQKNDLVLIKLEKLDLEGKRPVEVEVGSSDITGSNKVYDLIGLVDSTTILSSPNSVTISVAGRDLTKMLIEENSVFFPEQFAQDIFTSDGVLSKRNVLERDLQTVAFATYSYKTIETILKFIFNKYSNIGYVPSSAMQVWGQRAIKAKYSLGSETPILSSASSVFFDQSREGVWQIMELVIDKEVANRVLVDNNVVHDQGSIFNCFNKICQMPFVQFYTDTYGDKFYLIVRKPPFDKIGYKGLIVNNVTSTSSVNSTDPDLAGQGVILPQATVVENRLTAQQNLVIDIDDSVVLSDQLTYHDEIYSWFRIVPRGLNILDLASFALVPIVTLDAYAEVWGSRPMSIEYNYCPSDYVLDSNVANPQNYVELQVFKDLQFLIQSYQYLPFARRGRIIIDGDRRIKKGMMVRYKSTAEIFYVENVVHGRSVAGGKNNRSTTLTVTRGLREAYINGVDIQFDAGVKRVSYFNIVPTEIPTDASINNKEFLRDWQADRDILNFFLQRRQWQ